MQIFLQKAFFAFRRSLCYNHSGFFIKDMKKE